MHGRAGSSNIAQACRTTKDLEKTAGNATVFMACSLPMLFISAVQSRVGSGRDQCCCCHFIDRQSKQSWNSFLRLTSQGTRRTGNQKQTALGHSWCATMVQHLQQRAQTQLRTKRNQKIGHFSSLSYNFHTF